MIEINNFINRLNKNSPLKYNDESNLINYKYPYKPVLLLSIINSLSIDELFNCEINIVKNDAILKTYYDLIMNSEQFSDFLIKQKSKENWHIGFDDSIKKSIIDNIFSMPAKKLFDDNDEFWTYDTKNHTIKMNYNFKNENEKQELKQILLDQSIKCLINCIPDYKGFSFNEIIDYSEFMYQKILVENNDITKVKSRRYQHLFSKTIKDRDLKCIICCLTEPSLLEACHIKPYACCENNIDKYDPNNGITMCRNHHKLFDKGLFTFDNKWRLIISPKFDNNDADILIKTFEPCFITIPNKYYFDNIFVTFHHKNIFLN